MGGKIWRPNGRQNAIVFSESLLVFTDRSIFHVDYAILIIYNGGILLG
jgi:hypothetical protein